MVSWAIIESPRKSRILAFHDDIIHVSYVCTRPPLASYKFGSVGLRVGRRNFIFARKCVTAEPRPLDILAMPGDCRSLLVSSAAAAAAAACCYPVQALVLLSHFFFAVPARVVFSGAPRLTYYGTSVMCFIICFESIYHTCVCRIRYYTRYRRPPYKSQPVPRTTRTEPSHATLPKPILFLTLLVLRKSILFFSKLFSVTRSACRPQSHYTAKPQSPREFKNDEESKLITRSYVSVM